ncbi:hypothetical protein KFK09_006545 [Dendrobium nobile]|uniref:Uncharacterized protein n=1 Tax=Dendrobium nobile TaxID=94219 RepID=A0A8T3BPF9_DENNO|nr:hypothetical protein KFK09_006545 [Dendrobium nobile]
MSMQNENQLENFQLAKGEIICHFIERYRYITSNANESISNISFHYHNHQYIYETDKEILTRTSSPSRASTFYDPSGSLITTNNSIQIFLQQKYSQGRCTTA